MKQTKNYTTFNQVKNIEDLLQKMNEYGSNWGKHTQIKKEMVLCEHEIK